MSHKVYPLLETVIRGIEANACMFAMHACRLKSGSSYPIKINGFECSLESEDPSLPPLFVCVCVLQLTRHVEKEVEGDILRILKQKLSQTCLAESEI